ncbi:MAG: ABC transporter substrate-binding protein, partial [Bacillaceae bacterium]|nr:ABC transporter substrate-binding protein [Bacillaceae bacterium]
MKTIAPILLIMVITFLSACNNSSNIDQIELNFWTTTGEAETEALNKLIDQFENEHPNITINVE